MRTVSIGAVTVAALVDTEQAYAATMVYPGAGTLLDEYRQFITAEGDVTLNFASFLIRDGDTTVLVDTGWGPEYEGQLLRELELTGVAPSEVDMVMFTHLHGDHTGWNIDRATGKPLFGGARYLTPQGDWDLYSKEPSPASFVRDMLPLERDGVLEHICGERTLTSSMTIIPTPGHTPGHMSLAISSHGEHGFVLGDVSISPIDVEHPELESPFDSDHVLATRTRQSTIPSLAAKNTLIAASHLPAPGLGHYVSKGERYCWQALPD